MKSDPIREALKTGADPHMICATCPWDRTCIRPPAMTAGESDRDADRIFRQATAFVERAMERTNGENTEQ
jgi:hypothetical protein